MVGESMGLYDMIVIDYNQIRIEYIQFWFDLIFFYIFLYSPYIPISMDDLYCKFIKINKSKM
jgi:hypothetical protein